MTSPAPEGSLDAEFQRIRDMDASLNEQLRSFSEAARQRRPDFAAAIDRLVERLRQHRSRAAAFPGRERAGSRSHAR